MKKCILMVLLISMRNLLVFGAPTAKDAEATITYYNCQLNENGYTFSYTMNNGIPRYENGVLIRDPNRKSDEVEIIRADCYNLYRVDYRADENGYRTDKPISFGGSIGGQGGGSFGGGSISGGASFGVSSGAAQGTQSISSAALASLSGS
ncbi:uncharacterized protein LOC123679100 isoform X2 [Harmonia axyridis]|uniref:uncharacterized protein LOC123679100 isoform X2 n=1 Tax=Harmonia axyridis TaxID=115357 RepID=UPI001E2772A1|nr:uncharacterized protein LOC123679100 isoform X2 [Harmonia axyridis]